MKIAVIIPGWEHNPDEIRYTNIINLFQESGFVARSYNPDWSTHDPKDWVDGLVNSLKKNDGPITLLGFSMGAMTALLASSEIAVDTLILCSPSGYFKEYAQLLTPNDLAWGRENIIGFEQLSAVNSIKHAQVKKGHLLAGSSELDDWGDFKQWMGDLQLQTNWQLDIVPDTAHAIEAPNYQQALATLIHKL